MFVSAYRHYTNKESVAKIKETGVIKQSPSGPTAVDGSGTYVTRMPPTSPKIDIARNNYDDRESLPRKRIDEGKVNKCIEIHIPKNDPNIERVNVRDRDVHRYKGDINLKDYKHSFKSVQSDQ